MISRYVCLRANRKYSHLTLGHLAQPLCSETPGLPPEDYLPKSCSPCQVSSYMWSYVAYLPLSLEYQDKSDLCPTRDIWQGQVLNSGGGGASHPLNTLVHRTVTHDRNTCPKTDLFGGTLKVQKNGSWASDLARWIKVLVEQAWQPELSP